LNLGSLRRATHVHFEKCPIASPRHRRLIGLPWVLCAVLGIGLTLGAGARAGELDAFTGRLGFNGEDDPTTYTWGVEYREPLTDHWNASFVWLNEGHRPHDHRDGQAAQLWWHSKADPRGVVFEAGIGPYRYYDTRLLSTDPDFQDKHGWGVLSSVSVDYYFTGGWFAFLRVNEVDTDKKYDSTSLALGAGYRFSAGFDQSGGVSAAPWEVDILVGERIANTAHSETGGAEAIEARAALSDHFIVSATLLSGQGTLLDWRTGIAVELWLQQKLTSRFTVGAGIGAFIVSEDDSLRDASQPSNVAAMVSVSLAYSIAAHWQARVVWDRIGTGDDHDCDIVLFGAGYKF
jgi:hypothetical protein